MQEIWKVSRDPFNWRSQRDEPLVAWWWIAALLGLVPLLIRPQLLVGAKELPGVFWVLLVAIFTGLQVCLCAFLTISLTGDIVANQDALTGTTDQQRRKQAAELPRPETW